MFLLKEEAITVFFLFILSNFLDKNRTLSYIECLTDKLVENSISVTYDFIGQKMEFQNSFLGRAGILNIYQNQTQPDKADPLVNSAIKAFNNLLQPVKELTEEEMQERGVERLKDKVRITYPTKGSKTGLSDRFTSEYMIDRVTVGIVIVEGNGDPQYDSTPQERSL